MSRLSGRHAHRGSYGRCAASWLRAFACLLVLSLALGINAKSQGIHGYLHSRWTLREGAPPSIHLIASHADGFLWLGTSHGLYRVERTQFEPYRTGTSADDALSQDISVVKAL
jgi:ligand-binding sensor domain-containing protein